MKVQIGADKHSDLIHAVVTTGAPVHDLTPAVGLLQGDKELVYTDAGHQGIAKQPAMTSKTAEFRVAMRPGCPVSIRLMGGVNLVDR